MALRYQPMKNTLFFLLGALVTIVLGLGVSQCAHAAGDVAHLTWTLPSEYTDDTPLPAQDLATVTVSWFRATDPSKIVGSKSYPAAQLSADIAGMKCGDWQFVALITTTSTAKQPNATSAPAGPVTYPTGIACVPKAVGLTVS